jgi:hypothetical protein
MFTCAQPHARPTQQIFFLTAVTQENHLEYIISTLYSEEANTLFHLCLRTMHPTHGLFHTFTCAQPQARPTQQIFFLTSLHRRIIWSIISTLCTEEVSTTFQLCLDRNHIPISWEHPTHPNKFLMLQDAKSFLDSQGGGVNLLKDFLTQSFVMPTHIIGILLRYSHGL